MRFLVKFVLLVSVHKDIDFFSMYEDGFLLIRTNSLEGALAYLKGGAPIDAVILEASDNNRRTIELCNAIKRCKPAVNVIVLNDPQGPSPEMIPADLFLDRSFNDTQLATALIDALVEPRAQETWTNGARHFSLSNAQLAH